MKDNFDPYAVLGVSKDAPDFVIEAAYRACLKRFHPDKYAGSDANDRTAEVVRAYKLIREKPQAEPIGAESSNQSQTGAKATASGDRAKRHSDKPAEAIGGMSQNRFIGSLIAFVLVGTLAIALLVGIQADATDGSAAGHTSDYAANDAATDAVTMPAEEAVREIPAMPIATEAPVLASATGVTIPNLTIDTAPRGSEEQLDFGQIESAFDKFVGTFKRGGMRGARKYSEGCHKAAASLNSWSKNDFCAAFDFSAASLDKQMQALGTTSDQYFEFQNDNQKQYYYPRYQNSSDRLSQIEKAVLGKLKSVNVTELISR